MVRGNAPVGGAALIEGSSPTLSTCVFEGCQSAAAGAGFGGAVYIEGGTAAPRILSCTFVGNFANNGGALYLKYGGLAVEGCTFDRNVAAPVIGQGGAVYLDRSGPSSFSNTTITRCERCCCCWLLPGCCWAAASEPPAARSARTSATQLPRVHPPLPPPHPPLPQAPLAFLAAQSRLRWRARCAWTT